MTIKNVIKKATEKIEYIEAKMLIKYILNVSDNYLIINQDKEINKEYEKNFFDNVEKIYNGYPVQYIIKKQEFMGYEFYVDENVLIPQPDTEILVENVLKYATNNIKILDLCTGSGAIAISIKKYLKGADVYASDIDENALNVAKKNAQKHNVQINFIKSNMFENITDKFDIIVSNPPYIKTDIIKTLSKNVQNEPFIALDGGKDGLKFYKIIANEAKKYLKNNGMLFLEIGYDQKKEVQNLLKESICIQDYENRDRVIIWNLSHQK